MKSIVLSFLEQFWWLGVASLVAFPLTIAILPVVIIRLPDDYFMNEKPDGFISRQIFPLRGILLLLKNLLGGFLLLMGILMLFMPGQGVLTILAGLSIMNFPGKRKLELKIVSNQKVIRGLNWIRKKGKRKPFTLGRKLL